MTELTRDDARAIARVLYAVHQRRAAREEAARAHAERPQPDSHRDPARGDAHA